MIIDETIANIQQALAHFRALDPRLDAHLNGAPLPPGQMEAVAAGITNTATDEQIVQLRDMGWAPPVIGAPLWFLEEVATTYGQDRTDYLVDELCGLKVIQRDELSEPLLVMNDGKFYTVVPEWARKTAGQLQAEDEQRQARSGIVTPPQELTTGA